MTDWSNRLFPDSTREAMQAYPHVVPLAYCAAYWLVRLDIRTRILACRIQP